MAITPDIPAELRDWNAQTTSIAIADQRKGELLLATVKDGDCPSDLSKLFSAAAGQGLAIDGCPVEVKSFDLQGITVSYFDWSAEGNTAEIAPELDVECWDAVDDGRHNSNSFMTHWRGEFWLIHANSPFHFATPECKLILWRSKDAKEWTQVTTFQVPNEDIRDPKLSVINDKLFIYILKSFVSDGSEPYTTAVVYTEDGVNFSEMREIFNCHGWLFWNPRTFDNKTWYVPAYWGGHGESVVLKTTDGLHFEPVSYIHAGRKGFENDMNDETDFAFLNDGTLLSVQRLEYTHDINSDPRCCTNITKAAPPYDTWTELGKDFSTRLDGPNLFTYNGRVYAVGRRNGFDLDKRHHSGSALGRKRTSVYEVTEKGLVLLSDLPSSGDTAYGGSVMLGDDLYACYYSSDITKDWPWVIGMMSPSNIKMVKLSLARLEALADKRRREYDEKSLYRFIVEE